MRTKAGKASRRQPPAKSLKRSVAMLDSAEQQVQFLTFREDKG